jgi:hypothetical protein
MHSKTHPKVAGALHKLVITGHGHILVLVLVIAGSQVALAQTPQIVVPPVGGLSTLPQSPTIYPTGTPSLADASTGGAPTLRYRDPSKTLTLGEISDIQAQKANSEILRKFGFTDIEPIRPKPVAITLVKPMTSIKALAIWGRQDSLQAEILVNGVLHRVVSYAVVAPNLRVLRVRANGIDLEYDRPIAPPKAKQPKGSIPAPGKVTVTQRVSVGQSLEIPL